MLMKVFTRKKPTDENFGEERNLKSWVTDSLRNSVMEIVDTNLLKREDEYFAAKEECVSSAMRLALECTKDIPKERIDMKTVAKRLRRIRKTFLTDTANICKQAS